MILNGDEYYMRKAIDEALAAYEADEVPVGAVVVSKGKIISRSHNLCERLVDATAHAEMQAITAACNHLGSKYLNDCTLYVTLEPCMMCAGALYWSQIGKVVYGAADPKRGFSSSGKQFIHPKTEIVGGVLSDECGELVSRFFREKRNRP
ncbi:MAG: nucleoside deaminase [Salibacteraceae bacterium]